jgi:membrane glycosyltransferase
VSRRRLHLDTSQEKLGPRRIAFLSLVLGLTASVLGLAWHVLSAGGWSGLEVAILLCLAANAPWLALSGATGLVGFAVRSAAADPTAAVLPALRRAGGPPTARTVIAVCVRLEQMEAVLPPLESLLRGLRDGPGDGLFTLAVLSDTPTGEAATREEAAVRDLAACFPAGAVLYRRRAENAGFKAGNLMDFLDGDGAAFDFALVLDADSAMSADAVLRLARVMEAEPRLAVLQPTVAGRGADTVFGRLFGLGHRHGVRIWATGQAWWQGPHGPYWGHNAMLRVAAFRAHARLPTLPGGRHILSHDHVEAALLHGAGWEVRVLPDDAGSAERHPPDWPALFDRDLRWAAGNMQYLGLLRRPELGCLGRFQMLQAALHYLLTPLWFATLPLAALNVATGGADGTPRGALLALLALGFSLLNLPKLLGYAEAALGGAAPTARHAAAELLHGTLLDVVSAFDRSVTLVRLAFGGARGWDTQLRDGQALPWMRATRRFGTHGVLGLALAALFATGGPFPLLAALPALAGLILAVPAAVLTARPTLRRRNAPCSTACAPPGDRGSA